MPPLLRACHLEPTLAVTAITTVLALSTGRGSGAVLVALAVLAGQLSVGWSNDYLDHQRDRAARRTDKPVAAGELSPTFVRDAAVIALVLCIPLSLLSGWRAGVAHLVAVGSAWAYNLGLKSTVVSVLPYAGAFALLPSFVTLGLPGHPWPPWWATSAGALLGAGAHFTNTVPDLATDAETGVRGLPHRLGPRLSVLLSGALLGGACVLLAIGPPGAGPRAVVSLTLALLAVAAVTMAGLTGRAQLAWTLTLATAAFAVGLLLAGGESLT